MKCPRCQARNSADSLFCEECGSRLEAACPSCGQANRLGAKFCNKCGQPLVTAPERRPAVTEVAAERGEPEAERRQLTVMFCDLVDSTALAGQLDPEDFREVVRAYQATCAETIQRFDGHIAQYLGDGLLVYFGYPQAHEDDAHRAIRAGLGILESMRQLNYRLEPKKGIRLALRVGIHTGLVVVGDIGEGSRHEQLALGETPNVASRVQSIAEPDTVVVSASTYRLIQGYFTCQELGEQNLRGVAQPITVYRVIQESGAQSRLDVATTRGLTPLVGRESEVTLLLERWEQVKDGIGQVVLLSGEAGIGKSRLVQLMKEHVAGEPHSRLECRSSPYYQNTAFYPVTDLLQRTFQWQQDDSPEEKLEKLETALSHYRLTLEETVPLFATLLSLPIPEDRYPPLTLTPRRQRQKTMEVLQAMLLEQAAHQPVLFIVEDLQWVDPSTLELLSLVGDQAPTTHLCTLLTCRPTFQAPWGSRSYLTQVTLNHLSRTQVEQIVEWVTGGRSLPAEVLQQIVEKTDGVPLFVEELTKTVLESGLLRERDGHYELIGPLPSLAIPTTLHDSLMARLDRLVTAKGIAQLSAVIGRQFPYELLHAVSQLDGVMLQRELGRLAEAELLYQRGVPPQARYMFKHALIQEAAYQSLLRSTRQQYHQRIAQVLAERFPETAKTQPELLAHHYTEAGLSVQAIPYWQRAGQRAIERSAHAEAIGHLTKGLEVLTVLPHTPERTQQELRLQMALGVPLAATKGYGAAEVEKAYARARELCQQVGGAPQLFPVLHGLWRFYMMRAELQAGRELAEQLFSLAQRVRDSALLLEAHRGLGTTLLYLGEFVSARAHLEQGIALYDPQQYRSHALIYGQDPGTLCRAFAAGTLWLLGYPEQASKQIHEALTLAQELAHPFSLAFVLNVATMVYQFRREGQAAQERAEAAITLASEQQFPHWLAQGTTMLGWALAVQGRAEEGIAEMRRGLAAWRATGADIGRPYFLALLVEACRKGGQTEEGLTVLAEALATVGNSGECWWDGELYRLKGELLLALSADNHTEAETCFHQALDIARRQQARSLELRAVMSLSRLWHHQGKHEDARQMLAEVYGWFTEGFDTADLKEAKSLLEELS